MTEANTLRSGLLTSEQVRSLAKDHYDYDHDYDPRGMGSVTRTAHLERACKLARSLTVRPPEPLADDDAAFLRSWLRGQMVEYVAGTQGRAWDRESESDRAAMSEWVRADLDLGDSGDIAEQLCEASGWPYAYHAERFTFD